MKQVNNDDDIIILYIGSWSLLFTVNRKEVYT
jgi:hypothetical protein